MTPRIFMQRKEADGSASWLEFIRPVQTLAADTVDAVHPLLEEVQQASQQGRYVAGWVSYEAAPAFDALGVHKGPTPLAWFTVFEEVIHHTYCPLVEDDEYALGPLAPAWSEQQFCEKVATIKSWISEGHTYQVNLTFPLRTTFSGSAESLASRLFRGQQTQHGAYIETEDHIIISASPELFFDYTPPRIQCRPMKGTAARIGHGDAATADTLRTSHKNQAENVMIVDMVRNDLGRIATPGSVQVPKLYDIEAYPTVFQMTSTIEATTHASLVKVFEALFPCASVTGAPKVRTMEIIKDLEEAPRGAYTGAVGYIEPNAHAHFNVAIRTAEINKAEGQLKYAVGAGIVWDSEAEDEYRECLAKARVLEGAYPELQLLETLRWDPEEGFFLLKEHLNRLQRAAAYFGFPPPPESLPERLGQVISQAKTPQRIRLLYNADGVIKLECSDLPPADETTIWKIAIDTEPVQSNDTFLRHKTTRRQRYEEAASRHPDCHDALLYNERGEWTESCRANLALRFGDQWFTPPVDAGLLPGTYRQHLLANGQLIEKVLVKEDLQNAEEIALINSVRKWIQVEVVD